MRLVIVESPAKCSKIQGFLGLGYKVIASMGHIRALAHDLEAVGLTKNFEPTYEFMKEKAATIAKLKAEAKGAESIILCADDDREGEAIAYSIAVLLKLNVATNPRAAFREITKQAILDAIASPRTIDMNRVYSQQSRAMLDMMVGFTISPLLWKHVAPALSAGRCQTPALRLVCEREATIDAFKSDSSWGISGIWSGASKLKWSANMTDALGDEESAINYLENHKDDPSGVIKKAITKPWSESPPQALMTSTLQQQASNLYKCNPKRSMQIAQKLYEAGHITYMRTDQTCMSEEAVEQAKRIVEGKWGRQYIAGAQPDIKVKSSSKTKPNPGDAKVTDAKPQAQEAHEAIRPTHFERGVLPKEEDWGEQDRKIYRLIWLRALQSIMSQAKGEHRIVDFEATGDDGDFLWQAKWKRTTFPGWKIADEKDTNIAVSQDLEDLEDEVAGDAWLVAESLQEGHFVKWSSLQAKPQETKPQGRFTEATLVRELEKKGIGRPSTFASLIATIVDKNYVDVKDIPSETVESKTHTLTVLGQWPPTQSTFILKRGGEKTRMVPTPLGKTLLGFVLDKFPDLFSFNFTATMESRLDKIAEGSEPWKKVLEDTWVSYKDRYETLKKSGGGTAATSGNARRREFGDNLVAVITAKGPLLLREGETKEQTVFFGWPTKKSFQDLSVEEAVAFVAATALQKQGESIGEYNGHPVLLKKGQYGNYADCNGARVSVAQGEGLDEIIVKLQAKSEHPVRTLGPFQIRTGQYGPYLMKVTSGKSQKPQCISIPKDIDLDALTAQQAGEIFEAGLKTKAAFAKNKFKRNKN
jgi:DNA topoisomerase-1